MTDREVIQAFVEFLRARGHPGLRVDSWPEDTNRESSEVDAIAGSFVIEHTSVDTLQHQRRAADWFTKVVDGLETELSASVGFRLTITLEYDAVHRGQDWLAIRRALAAWISNEAPVLADGRHVVVDIAGIPFPLHVTKASDRRPKVVFGRYEPNDTTLSTRIRCQFDRKARKLAKYQGTEKPRCFSWRARISL